MKLFIKQLLSMLGAAAGFIVGGSCGYLLSLLLLTYLESGSHPDDDTAGPLFLIVFFFALITVGAFVGCASGMWIVMSLVFPEGRDKSLK